MVTPIRDIVTSDSLVGTVSHFHNIEEFVGPDFVTIGITIRSQLYVDNCIVGEKDWLPKVGDLVVFRHSEEHEGGFLVVTPFQR